LREHALLERLPRLTRLTAALRHERPLGHGHAQAALLALGDRFGLGHQDLDRVAHLEGLEPRLLGRLRVTSHLVQRKQRASARAVERDEHAVGRETAHLPGRDGLGRDGALVLTHKQSPFYPLRPRLRLGLRGISCGARCALLLATLARFPLYKREPLMPR